MPSALIHLHAGRILKPKAPAEFFTGTLAPDCIKSREEKDLLHLRLSDDRERDLLKLASEWDMDDPFQLGAMLHLYTDWLWDEGPQTDHKRAYTGNSWFPDYRHEINLASCHMYHHRAWAPDMFEAMISCDNDLLRALPDYPPEKIKPYIEYTEAWVSTHDTEPSSFFPPRLIDSFCRETAERFSDFLKRV